MGEDLSEIVARALTDFKRIWNIESVFVMLVALLVVQFGLDIKPEDSFLPVLTFRVFVAWQQKVSDDFMADRKNQIALSIKKHPSGKPSIGIKCLWSRYDNLRKPAQQRYLRSNFLSGWAYVALWALLIGIAVYGACWRYSQDMVILAENIGLLAK